jgi:hypothetical protein
MRRPYRSSGASIAWAQWVERGRRKVREAEEAAQHAEVERREAAKARLAELERQVESNPQMARDAIAVAMMG